MSLTSNFRYVIDMVSSALRKKANVSDLDIYETETNVDRKLAPKVNSNVIARDGSKLVPGDWYVPGSYCVYNNDLYKANVSTTGPFDPTDWDKTTVSDEIYDLESSTETNLKNTFEKFNGTVVRQWPLSIERGNYYAILGDILGGSYWHGYYYLFRGNLTTTVNQYNYMNNMTATDLTNLLSSLNGRDIKYTGDYVLFQDGDTVGYKLQTVDAAVTTKLTRPQKAENLYVPSDWLLDSSTGKYYVRIRSAANFNIDMNDSLLVFISKSSLDEDAVFTIGDVRDDRSPDTLHRYEVPLYASKKPTTSLNANALLLKDTPGMNFVCTN